MLEVLEMALFLSHGLVRLFFERFDFIHMLNIVHEVWVVLEIIFR